MDKLSKGQILASSSGWVASLLNFLPGVGAGYLYQRRWSPYFITAGAVTTWVIIGIILRRDTEPNQTEQLIGIGGLFIISTISVVEANLAFKKALKTTSIKKEETKTPIKKGWFK